MGVVSDSLSADIASVLGSTAYAFERHWHYTQRAEPLLPIGLDDVETWLDLGPKVRADDIELFALPPKAQAGQGGDFNSAPVPVPVKDRLKTVRKAFGSGRALVINSLHRWCPKAARFAELLFKQVGLPVDVYMYLTPPYSHSYGLHKDVMDAFMVQLVGSKRWTACDSVGRNCSDLTTAHGDVLYLPMGAKHSAWTTNELSAHLTVNVERQFYVWGSIFQALVPRLLVPKMKSSLDDLRDMSGFGMERSNEFAAFADDLGLHVPTLLRMPAALLNHTRHGSPLEGSALEGEWLALLGELQEGSSNWERWKKPVKVGRHTFKPAASILEELKKVKSESLGAGLKWVAKLLKKSVKQMQDERGWAPALEALPRSGGPQKLGRIAEKRAAKMREESPGLSEL